MNSLVNLNITPLLNHNKDIPEGVKILIEAHALFEGFTAGSRSFRNNNPGNLNFSKSLTPFGAVLETDTKAEKRFAKFPTLAEGIAAKFAYLKRIKDGHNKNFILGGSSPLYNGIKGQGYIDTYAPETDNNKPVEYANYIIRHFKKHGYTIYWSTSLNEIFELK